MQSSISIEGFNVPAGEGARIVAGDQVPEAQDADRAALASYARAMEFSNASAPRTTYFEAQ